MNSETEYANSVRYSPYLQIAPGIDPNTGENGWCVFMRSMSSARGSSYTILLMTAKTEAECVAYKAAVKALKSTAEKMYVAIKEKAKRDAVKNMKRNAIPPGLSKVVAVVQPKPVMVAGSGTTVDSEIAF